MLSSATITVTVQPCYVGPAGSKIAVCGATKTIKASNVAPTKEPNNLALSVGPTGLKGAVSTLAFTLRDDGHTFADVEIESTAGGVTHLAALGSSVTVPITAKNLAVRSCNLLGCSPPSVKVLGAGCSAKQELDAAGKCVPCSLCVQVSAPKKLLVAVQ